MIDVTVYVDSNKKYKGYRVCGHAGYDEYGHDIICAAASVIAQNTANSIEKFTQDRFKTILDEDEGLLEIKFIGDIGRDTILLMKSFELGIESIVEDNEDYIKMRYKEV